MDSNFIIEEINCKLITTQDRSLTQLEIFVLKWFLESKTYQQISEQYGCGSSYIRIVVVPNLFEKLSTLTGSKLTRKNCRSVLENFLTIGDYDTINSRF